MPNIIGVQFKPMGKIYYFDPKDMQFEVNDGAVVETSHGIEYGTVMIANKEIAAEELKSELKAVVRKATEKDTQHHQEIVAKRLQAIRDAQKKANAHKLDMKIVDAEFAFDNTKVVFYFTADTRIDFRELVKDLAATYRMRIDLRQIGIRDECKMKGGLGPCGRVCCCSDYLNDFARVSIKMAKTQGLSLNPSAISGLCGRLMCCLKFEDDYYSQISKFMPKINSEITTPAGKGKVLEVDMLRQLITVRVVKNAEETEMHTYTAEELGINPTYVNNAVANETADDDATDEIPEDLTE